jgi:predicted solute-binding protein
MFDLLFRVPSECADLVASGGAEIGIVPSYELLKQELEIIPGVGIASRGRVRSILLVSKVPAGEIRILAGDRSSRTSVALARIILRERYGAEPHVISHAPDLEAMLAAADAALIIGDPALRLDPDRLPFHVYDLGHEWTEFTGLPMVYAVWAGPRAFISAEVIAAFQGSCRYGLERLEEIVAQDVPHRSVPPDLARKYLTQNVVLELTGLEMEGLSRFHDLAGNEVRHESSVTI